MAGPRVTRSEVRQLRRLAPRYPNFKALSTDLGLPYRMVLAVLKTGVFNAVPSPPKGGKPIRINGVRYILYKDGRVWSRYSRDWMKPDVDEDGYRVITLGGRKIKLHRLLLMMFVRKPKKGEVARHIDGNTSRNVVSNLRWGSTSDNERDKWRHGTHNKGERHGRARLTDEVVIHLRQLCQRASNKTAFYKQQSKKYGASWQAIGHACTGRTWTHL